MHFYESSIITTKDGLHCQVYGNEHPIEGILVKPKYIPTDKIESDGLQYRFISGKKMNRLNLWSDQEKLDKYIEDFKKAYPHYILHSDLHCKDRLFFFVPIDKIERIYYPRHGLKELMSMPFTGLDDYLKNVHEFVTFLLGSGLKIKDLGITYSTLMGHYMANISDINIVVYGKENFWKLMRYLEITKHPKLAWKTNKQWVDFFNRRNRFNIFGQEKFVELMSRKKSEGYFGGPLFVIFGAEKDDETWHKWGTEKYSCHGFIKMQATVEDDFSSIVRPGCYLIKDSKVIEGNNVKIDKVAFYSRDYCMLAKKGEVVEVCGMLEKVEPIDKTPYYRVVVGYFDAYLNNRREKEYIRVI